MYVARPGIELRTSDSDESGARPTALRGPANPVELGAFYQLVISWQAVEDISFFLFPHCLIHIASIVVN